MTRYKLITPHGMYAPGVILDTELPPHRPFSIEQPTAKRLCELGVMEPLDQEEQEPVQAGDDPGWSQSASVGRPATLDAQAPAPQSSSSAGPVSSRSSRRKD